MTVSTSSPVGLDVGIPVLKYSPVGLDVGNPVSLSVPPLLVGLEVGTDVMLVLGLGAGDSSTGL